MANPTPTARQTPAGIRLEDGYQSLITFAADPDVSLWEMTVKPGGVDGGEKIATSTMHNDEWRTFAPRALKTLTDGQVKFAYDPAVKTQLVSLINRRTTITVAFPDGSTEASYGYLQSAEFDPLEEGTMPTGTAIFVATNFDHVNKVEAGPAVASVAGT